MAVCKTLDNRRKISNAVLPHSSALECGNNFRERRTVKAAAAEQQNLGMSGRYHSERPACFAFDGTANSYEPCTDLLFHCEISKLKIAWNGDGNLSISCKKSKNRCKFVTQSPISRSALRPIAQARCFFLR